MNCKPGDLAIVVRSRSGLNFGKVVRVVAASSEVEVNFYLSGLGFTGWAPTPGFMWKVEEASIVYRDDDKRFLIPFISDHALLPLHPGDAVDEVLQLLPVPHKEMA